MSIYFLWHLRIQIRMKTMNAFVCKTKENLRKFYVYKNILKTCNAIDMLINLQFSLTSSKYYKFQRSVDTYLCIQIRTHVRTTKMHLYAKYG